IFLIVSSGSPLALIASSLRSTSKKPVCPMTRSLHPPMAHCRQRVRFAATWREEFFEVPLPEKMFLEPKCLERGSGDGERNPVPQRGKLRGEALVPQKEEPPPVGMTTGLG